MLNGSKENFLKITLDRMTVPVAPARLGLVWPGHQGEGGHAQADDGPGLGHEACVSVPGEYPY